MCMQADTEGHLRSVRPGLLGGSKGLPTAPGSTQGADSTPTSTRAAGLLYLSPDFHSNVQTTHRPMLYLSAGTFSSFLKLQQEHI